uniref:Uncharacterized protein n=1 Tax=Oryza meridionalis TaxID=40149 RepID=A0A0E0CMC1_9ORYZ
MRRVRPEPSSGTVRAAQSRDTVRSPAVREEGRPDSHAKARAHLSPPPDSIPSRRRLRRSPTGRRPPATGPELVRTSGAGSPRRLPRFGAI